MHVNAGAPLDGSCAEERGSSEERDQEEVRDSVLKALEQRLAEKKSMKVGEGSKAARVKVDKGMTPVPRWLAVRIKRGDFADLPPAKPDEGRARKHYDPQALWREADYRKATRRVPDMTTWTRCFLLYEGLLLQARPERQSDLRSYHDLIARMAQKYEWAACKEYDRRFRERVEGDDTREWADTDPGLFAEYVSAFTLEKQLKGRRAGEGQLAHSGDRRRGSGRLREWRLSRRGQMQAFRFVRSITDIRGTANTVPDVDSSTSAAGAGYPIQ